MTMRAAIRAIRPGPWWIGLAGVPFLPMMGNHFLMVDDLWHIGTAKCRLEQGWVALFEPRSYYRPVRDLLYAGLDRLGGDASWIWFHMLQLACHLLNVWLVARMIGRVTGRVGVGWAAALLFGILAIHREVVIWMSNLNHVLACTVALVVARAVLEAWVAGRPAAVWWAAAGFLLALCAFPAWPLLPVWLLTAASLLGLRPHDRWRVAAMLGLGVAVWSMLDWLIPLISHQTYSGLSQDYGWRRAGLMTRALIGNALYAVVPSEWFLPSATWAGLVQRAAGATIVWGLLGIAARSGRRVSWILLAGYVTGMAFFLPRFVADTRHLYLPSVFVCAWMALGAVRVHEHGVNRWAARAIVLLVALCGAVNAGRTIWWTQAFGEAGRVVDRVRADLLQACPRPPDGRVLVLNDLPWWSEKRVPLFGYPYEEGFGRFYGVCRVPVKLDVAPSLAGPRAVTFRFAAGRLVRVAP